MAFSNGLNTISTAQTSLISGITYQSKTGFLGELSMGRSNMYEIRNDTDIVPIDESYSSTMLGFGYRMPTAHPGRYWGFGYRNAMSEGSTANTLRTFWEKDNELRYGVINLSASADDTTSMLSLAGQHVWFLNKTTGLGLNWSVGSGRTDDYTAAATASLGATLMFRPDF
jgi:hypothetical protein